MGLFGRIFGSRRDSPESLDGSLDTRLLHHVGQQLLASGVPLAAGVTLFGRQLVSPGGRFAVTVEVREATAERVHAHVVTWLPDPAAPGGATALDACVMGLGPSADAVEQAAGLWLRLAGAPVLSYLSGQPVLDADHFGGDEPWGVPGGHGFVGPFMARGEAGAVDLAELAQSEAFRFAGYPRDGRRHLVKVTLLGGDGRWTRYLEIDGHDATQVDEDWRGGLPSPRSPVVCVRFAVFDINE